MMFEKGFGGEIGGSSCETRLRVHDSKLNSAEEYQRFMQK